MVDSGVKGGESMTRQGTAKGALLTAGIAFLSVGATFLTTDRWWVGIVIALSGAGFIFLREWIKEA